MLGRARCQVNAETWEWRLTWLVRVPHGFDVAGERETSAGRAILVCRGECLFAAAHQLAQNLLVSAHLELILRTQSSSGAIPKIT